MKKIVKRLEKTCACCAAKIKVISYEDKTYRGGHYFGKINVGKTVKYEYWECPKCYW